MELKYFSVDMPVAHQRCSTSDFFLFRSQTTEICWSVISACSDLDILATGQRDFVTSLWETTPGKQIL